MPPSRRQSEAPEVHPYRRKPLQRGTACLQCRKLKLKCGGEKPACEGCRSHHQTCEYENTQFWNKARRLKLEVAQLKQENYELSLKIAAWEAAERCAPPLTAYPAATSDRLPDPPAVVPPPKECASPHTAYYTAYYLAAAPDCLPEPPAIVQAAEHWQHVTPTAYFTNYCPAVASDRVLDPPAIPEKHDTWMDTDLWSYVNIPPESPVPALQTLPEPSAMAEEMQHPATPAPEYGSLDFVLTSPAAAALIGSQCSATHDAENLQLPARYRCLQVSRDDRDALLGLYFSHTGPLNIGPDAEEFTSRLGSDKKPDDALLHAMFLVACRFSSDPRIRRQEVKYRQRAEHALKLERWDKGVQEVCDCIQASHLLAHHAYSMDNPAQADLHLLTAASLATNLTGSPMTPPPPLSAAQKCALQQAYTFDRLMAAALGTNGTFPECFGGLPGKEENDKRKASGNASGAARSRCASKARPRRSSPPASMTPEQTNSLRAQAAEKVWIVGQDEGLHREFSRPGPSPSPENLRPSVKDRDIRSELSALREKLPPVNHSNTADPCLLGMYTQVNAAILRAKQGGTTADEAAEAASVVSDVLAFICGLGDADYKELDPLMGMSWQWVVKYLLDELERKLHSRSARRRFTDAIKLLLSAMGKLADEFPVVSVNIANIEERCLRLGIPTP